MPVASQSRPSAAYLQRLIVYVAWHPDFVQGSEIAGSLYANLSRPTANPTARGMGIPVLFRSQPEQGKKLPPQIPFDECHHTAAVVLVDDAMVASDDWTAYVEQLWRAAQESNHRHRIYPVKLSPNAFNLSRSIAQANFIRPLGANDHIAADGHVPDAVLTRLTTAVAHELCRLLLSRDRLNQSDSNPPTDEKKVTVFISHTKADGEPTARAIKEYIQGDTQLRTFFDANDIPYGEQFDPVLRRNIQDGALLIVETDLYSSSMWCLDELLEAKRHRRPILVVNASEAEERGSVYIGNVPTARHAPEYYPRIIKRLVLEVLRCEHFIQHFKDLKALYKISPDVEPLPYPPEPLTVADLRMANVTATTFVYPDPPLNRLELERLRVLDNRLIVTTPLLLLATAGRSAGEGAAATARAGAPTKRRKHPPDRTRDAKQDAPAPTDSVGPTPRLAGLTIGLSIGNSPDLPHRGMGNEHLNDALVAFALYLLASGAELAYGGVPQLETTGKAAGRADFLEVLLELLLAYSRTTGAGAGSNPIKLKGFLAEAFAGLASASFRARWKNVFQINQIPAGSPAPRDDAPTDQRAHFVARSLTAMRQSMNDAVSARVLLGGKLAGAAGKYPGVIEEAYLAMRARKPVYLVGSFGGAAAAVVDAVLGSPGDIFNPSAKTARPTTTATTTDPDAPDLPALADYFRSVGAKGLAKTNGLSEQENRRLFRTPHVPEMVFLVLRGLSRIAPEATPTDATSPAS